MASVVWNLLLFALLRSSWFERHALFPFTKLQAMVAAWYTGAASARVTVTLDCSGADTLALCTGFMLAFPASWRRRAVGIATILPLLLLLNITRIVTLSTVAASPVQFQFLHVYGWPTVLILAAAGLVYMWMLPLRKAFLFSGRSVRIALYTFGAFVLAAPWIMPSTVVAKSCAVVASLASLLMGALGADVTAAGAVLHTPRGGFIVTPECILSPVIPLWVAAVWWYPLSRSGRLVGLALTIPVITVLAVLRLLVLAAPGAWIESPLIFVHGFHQLVLFAAVVMIAALYGATRAGSQARRPVARGLFFLAVSAAGALALGPVYNKLIVGVSALLAFWAPHAIVTLRSATDVQGAVALLPVYQVALLLAMVGAFGRPIRWRPLLVALGVLATSQVLLLVGLGEVEAHAAVYPHALVLRGWAVILPVVLALLVLGAAGRTDATGIAARTAAYRTFWDDVGKEFPDLGGAASTELYCECEKRLIGQHLPDLVGKRVFKSDLWDEARNTRILQWIGQQGARVVGIDISKPTIDRARQEFRGAPLRAACADVRALPFQDESFDVIYSMGTIEHFAETKQAIRELLRVLKPGGRAIVGVPNRLDPFLRPLFVAVLYRLGLYDYGFEKSYSRTTLRRMLTDAGFSVVGDDGILFIPGWLRMLDLLFHTRMPSLARVTKALVRAFTWLEKNVPAVRRHGYLVVAIAERPHQATQNRQFSSVGCEWLVDAFGCQPHALRSRERLQSLFAAIISGLGLKTVGLPMWHTFEGEAGITGLQGLCESHLTCHTYPEAGYAAFSLYCCRPDVGEWPWRERLAEVLGATEVSVRVVSRGKSQGTDPHGAKAKPPTRGSTNSLTGQRRASS